MAVCFSGAITFSLKNQIRLLTLNPGMLGKSGRRPASAWQGRGNFWGRVRLPPASQLPSPAQPGQRRNHEKGVRGKGAERSLGWSHHEGHRWFLHARSASQSCLTLWDSMNCSPLGSFVHGIFYARILEWVAISSSRGPSWLRDRAHAFWVSCTGSFDQLSSQGSLQMVQPSSKEPSPYKSPPTNAFNTYNLPTTLQVRNSTRELQIFWLLHETSLRVFPQT